MTTKQTNTTRANIPCWCGGEDSTGGHYHYPAPTELTGIDPSTPFQTAMRHIAELETRVAKLEVADKGCLEWQTEHDKVI